MRPRNGDAPGEVEIDIANAAYLQRGYPFEQTYIDAVTASYGPVLHAVDFAADPDAVAHQINELVAVETRNRIVDPVGDGALSEDTKLALVNAAYLRASWVDVFPAGATKQVTFSCLDGRDVTVPMMHGAGGSSAQGEGWVGATKSYVGGLAAQFILPDHGRFDDVAGDLATVLRDYEANRTRGSALAVPRFETRYRVDLPDALCALGLRPLFHDTEQLLGIAPDPDLKLDRTIHATFLAIDEEGTEAAAATIVTAVAVSMPARPPVPVVLDRPFLFRILDTRTGTSLFVGQIRDPS